MNIFIASSNQHKIREFEALLPNHRLIPASYIDPHFDPVEKGTSFIENSMIKAQALTLRIEQLQGASALPPEFEGAYTVLADDSGLCVDALEGRPGIYSARYGRDTLGPEITAKQQYELLLKELEGETVRSARYICCMTVMFSSHRFFCAQESWEGEIGLSASSSQGGFGYDPIFFIPEQRCYAAELSDTQKHELSHRGKAIRSIARYIG